MLRKLLIGTSLLLSASAYAQPQVLTSIKPLQLLVDSLTEGEVSANYLIEPQFSPHDYSLRPSDMRRIKQSDLVIWVGEDLEPFLAKALEQAQRPNLNLLANEAILASVKANKHDEHGHHDKGEHDEHAHHDHAEHHDEHAHHEHDAHHDEHDSHNEHDHHDGHEHHHDFDPHIWLSLSQAKLIATLVTDELIKLEPSQREHRFAQLARFNAQADALKAQLMTQLKPYQAQGYFVFHDAYTHFERDMNLNKLGAFTINPTRSPGAKTLHHIRQELEADNARCIFAEPQFNGNILSVISRDTKAQIGQLDPLGLDLEKDANYFDFIKMLANSFEQCLSLK